MTMPYGSAEEPEVIETALRSVPIHVASSDLKPGKNIGAEYGKYRTFLVANLVGPSTVTPGAQRILNRSLRRYEARIRVLPTIAAQNVLDGVIIGSKDEILQGGQPGTPGVAVGTLGGYLQVGNSDVYKAQEELWVCYPVGNVNSVYVTVLDLQWASPPDSYKEYES